MAKNNNSLLRSILTSVFVVLVIVYVGYQVYRTTFSDIQTELASTHSVYESVSTDALVFRAETVIPTTGNGHPYYTVENGTRVAKGGVIASVYPTTEDGDINRQIGRIKDQIAMLKTIASGGATNQVSLDVINDQLLSTVRTVIRNADAGQNEGSSENKDLLLSLLCKQQVITGKQLDLSDKIASLEQKIDTLNSQYHAPVATVTAPVAGYFADTTDGYENILTTDELTTLTTDKLQQYLDMEVNTPADESGKIVNGYEWFMACTVPESYYNSLSEGNSVSVRMAFVTDDDIPVTVKSCKKDGKGNLLVILRCVYMSESLSTVRKEAVQLQLVKYTGIKVPKKAILINDEGQTGVYIRSGNVVSFRKIEQIFSEPSDYVICETEPKDSDYLRLYDDIIIRGRDLYDGKII